VGLALIAQPACKLPWDLVETSQRNPFAGTDILQRRELVAVDADHVGSPSH
jgi:hypothetical protein